jgi:hypothetical protein
VNHMGLQRLNSFTNTCPVATHVNIVNLMELQRLNSFSSTCHTTTSSW